MSFDTTTKVTSLGWTWTFPGAPISIKVALGFVQKLHKELQGRTFETGGLLLGYPGKTEGTVEILDYLTVPSGGRAGGPYYLDTSQLDRVRRAAADPRSSVVGFFRTQSNGDLALRDDEIDLVRSSFSDAHNVVLLISTGSNPFKAGFLFWYGEVFTPVSFSDFPLDVRSLSGEVAQPRPSPPPTELPKPRKVEAPPKVVVKVESTAREVVKVDPPAMEVVKVDPPPAMEVVKAVVPAPKAAKVPTSKPKAEIEPISNRTLILASIAVLIVGVIAALLIPSAPPPQVGTALHLEVEPQSRGLNIRWDSQNALVKGAREGKLEIQERNQKKRTIELDPEQLAGGHVYFQSSSDRLQVELEVLSGSGQTAKETVLAIAPRASATSSNENPPLRPRRDPSPPTSQPTIQAVPTKKVLPSLERSDSELIPHGRELQIAVTLQLDENGRVIAEKPTQRRSAPERLERLALEAALQWQFEPAKWGDRPMPSEYTVVFAFQR